MRKEKTTLEIIAPTPEEAIARGLSQLGLPENAVEVETLDQGSRGIFGLGGRQARIRLTIKNEQDVNQQGISTGEQISQPLADEEVPEKERIINTSGSPIEEDTAMQLAHEVIGGLLEKMRIHARISTRYIHTDEEEDQKTILVDIQGDDLSILIGRRSETLNALQYITSLIINKEIGRWVPILVDVQGYRARRERQLKQLAHRMAEQTIHTGRKQILEPMPANERRLIHLELRDHSEVITESIGEEPNRKVTIKLKK